MTTYQMAETNTAESSPGSEAHPVGVALGGGGVRGWAHVGVISVLEELGVRPSMVAGCSAGALIGAYYASGHSVDTMRRYMREQRTTSLFSLRFDGLGLLSTDGFRDYLRSHLGDARFEDLPIPFYVVCTDLETGKEVVLNRGSLVEAILASSAIPGIFPPVEMNGHLLVDGGLSNNVPVSALVNAGARYTVAVRLHQDTNGLTAPALTRQRTSASPVDGNGDKRISLSMWSERLTRTLRRDSSHLPNGFEVLGRAMELVMTKLEGYRLQVYKPDVLITPRVAHIGTLSFSEEKEDIFSCGVAAAREQEAMLREIVRRVQD